MLHLIIVKSLVLKTSVWTFLLFLFVVLTSFSSLPKKVETKVRKCLSSTKSRLKHLEERKEKLNNQEKRNDEWLQRTQNDLKMLDSGSGSVDAISFLNVYENSCSNELLAKGLKQECKYYKKCMQNYESQSKREKRCVPFRRWSWKTVRGVFILKVYVLMYMYV